MPDDTKGRTRRGFVKTAAAAGALGALAGCAGADESTPQDNGETAPQDGGDEVNKKESRGQQETTKLSYYTGRAAESPKHKAYFLEGIEKFESQRGDVEIDLNAMATNQLRKKVPAQVQAGNPPDIAHMGSPALPYFFQDKLLDPEPYLTESGVKEDLIPAQREGMEFRDKFWSFGALTTQVTMLTLNPDAVKSAGISDPESELKTWTDYRRLLNKLNKNPPVKGMLPYEESGASWDLESYWSKAFTATKPTEDPWFSGLDTGKYDPTKAQDHLRVGQGDATDGMIKNTLDLAKEYGSGKVGSRVNEDFPPMILTDQLATHTTGTGRIGAYKAVDPKVKTGWDGDVYYQAMPKLDANYGKEFDIPELAGKTGDHGGHCWTLESLHVVFNKVKDKGAADLAWDFMNYINFSDEFTLPFSREIQTSQLPTKSLNKKFRNKYKGDMPQGQAKGFELLEKHKDNYIPAGAPWDVRGTGQLRWTDLNKTLSQALAGQHSRDKTPGLIRKRMMKTLKERNEGFKM